MKNWFSKKYINEHYQNYRLLYIEMYNIVKNGRTRIPMKKVIKATNYINDRAGNPVFPNNTSYFALIIGLIFAFMAIFGASLHVNHTSVTWTRPYFMGAYIIGVVIFSTIKIRYANKNLQQIIEQQNFEFNKIMELLLQQYNNINDIRALLTNELDRSLKTRSTGAKVLGAFITAGFVYPVWNNMLSTLFTKHADKITGSFIINLTFIFLALLAFFSPIYFYIWRTFISDLFKSDSDKISKTLQYLDDYEYYSQKNN